MSNSAHPPSETQLFHQAPGPSESDRRFQLATAALTFYM